ncbi:MAG: hypothetical protein AAGJ94_17805, partial [Pseudomonadota bacterium]
MADPDGITQKALAAESQGDLERALILWQNLAAERPNMASAHIGVIRCLLGLNKPHDALEKARALCAQRPDLAPSHRWRARAANALKDHREAAKSWSR